MISMLASPRVVPGPRGSKGLTVDARNAGILVIDDDAEVLETMIEILEDAGFSPVGMTESHRALRILGFVIFDLIISDIMMPGLDGLRLLEIVKQQRPQAEVLLVTGHGTNEIARRAWQAGACGFLEKPFEPDAFVGVVQQVLWRSRMRNLWRAPETEGS